MEWRREGGGWAGGLIWTSRAADQQLWGADQPFSLNLLYSARMVDLGTVT